MRYTLLISTYVYIYTHIYILKILRLKIDHRKHRKHKKVRSYQDIFISKYFAFPLIIFFHQLNFTELARTLCSTNPCRGLITTRQRFLASAYRIWAALSCTSECTPIAMKLRPVQRAPRAHRPVMMQRVYVKSSCLRTEAATSYGSSAHTRAMHFVPSTRAHTEPIPPALRARPYSNLQMSCGPVGSWR